MATVRVTTVGNSLGIILPKEVLARLRIAKGDTLHLLETVDGIQLCAYDPNFERQVELIDQVARAQRDVLRALVQPRQTAAVPVAPESVADMRSQGQNAPAQATQPSALPNTRVSGP
jgi:putative addiction module antidote